MASVSHRHDGRVGIEIVVHHPRHVEPGHGIGSNRLAIETRRPIDGGDGARDIVDEEACRARPAISSPIEPRRKAITGVPQAIASTTL